MYSVSNEKDWDENNIRECGEYVTKQCLSESSCSFKEDIDIAIQIRIQLNAAMGRQGSLCGIDAGFWHLPDNNSVAL